MPGIFLALPFCLCYTELAAILKAAYSLPYFVHFLTPPLLRHISLFKLCKTSCNGVLCARAAIHRGAATMPFLIALFAVLCIRSWHMFALSGFLLPANGRFLP